MSDTLPTRVRVVIAAPPGLMRNSLQSLLRAMPQVNVIALTETLETVRAMIDARTVDCIFLDAEIAEAHDAQWTRVTTQACVHCLLLAASTQQADALRAQGMPHVVLKNYLDENLIRDWLNTRALALRAA